MVWNYLSCYTKNLVLKILSFASKATLRRALALRKPHHVKKYIKNDTDSYSTLVWASKMHILYILAWEPLIRLFTALSHLYYCMSAYFRITSHTLLVSYLSHHQVTMHAANTTLQLASTVIFLISTCQIGVYIVANCDRCVLYMRLAYYACMCSRILLLIFVQYLCIKINIL